MAEIEGTVERIKFRDEESYFTVAQVTTDIEAQPVTVVGEFIDINAGERLRLRGEWQMHSQYGKQFRVTGYRVCAPVNVEGIKKYLGSGMIKGIGPATAKKLVEEFAEQTLKVIESEPERLTKVEGIGPKKLQLIKTGFREHREIQDIMVFLQGHGISPSYATRIYRHYGQDCISIVRENPYRLATDVSGIGFKTADRIAPKLGIAPDSPKRVQAGILYLLEQGTENGHVFLPLSSIVDEAKELLKVDTSLIRSALDDLRHRNNIIVEPLPADYAKLTGGEESNAAPADSACYLRPLYLMEKEVSRRLIALTGGTGTLPLFDPAIDEEIRQREEAAGFSLSNDQKQAVKEAVETGVLVVTGGPGTGKTTIIRFIISILEARGNRVYLASPTGRAAKRMQEATGKKAKTVHRLLEFSYVKGKGLSFARNEDKPLNTEVLIIDEASMVDLRLMGHLLRALRRGTRLVLVGDMDQLPSVGAGNVLRDIIRSESLPVVRLQHIYRQGRESMITLNAHRINRGEFPLLNNKNRDFFFIHRDDAEKVVEEITELVASRLPRYYNFDPVTDIQVLSPMNKGTTGVFNLNDALQQVLNPARRGKPELTYGSFTFRPGDKVMQIRNNYDTMIFNGDMGRIKEVDPENGVLVVGFEDSDGVREVSYDSKDLDQLVPAYAISVHKSQGSEYPAVVMPVTTQHYIMLQRNLLYTAITRARKLVVLVGTEKAIHIAINNADVGIRHSLLATRLQQDRYSNRT